MPSTNADIYLRLAELHGLIDVASACAVSGGNPNAAVKALASLVNLGRLAKAPYIHPRCYWHPRHPLGAQGLILASSVLYRCVVAEPRIWTPEGREGPATLISCEGEREAVFVDFGASPRHVARKLDRWCGARDLSGLTALGVVVPSEAKARSVHEAAEDLPLPVRFVVSEDLRSLTCAKARR
jgi:hypothetical protein